MKLEYVRAAIGIFFFLNALGVLWGMLLGWFPDIPNAFPLIACILLALMGFIAVPAPAPALPGKKSDEEDTHK